MGASRAFGVRIGARAGFAGSADSRDTGAEAAAAGRARQRRVRPGAAGGQHLTARPVAEPPSLSSSEPRRTGARFGRGVGERERERVRQRGREDCAGSGAVRTASKKELMPWVTMSSSEARDASSADSCQS